MLDSGPARRTAPGAGEARPRAAVDLGLSAVSEDDDEPECDHAAYGGHHRESGELEDVGHGTSYRQATPELKPNPRQ